MLCFVVSKCWFLLVKVAHGNGRRKDLFLG